MIDQIKVSLDENPNLNDELRNNIFELVLIFQKQFPEVRLKNLNERLKTLKIERANKYVQPYVINYLPLENKLLFNVDELAKEHDGKHLLMFALLQIITANGNNVGFDVDHKFEALNIGYTEILTSNLVGNDSDQFYFPIESTYANIIGIVVGVDKLKEAYFYNKPATFIQALEELGVEL